MKANILDNLIGYFAPYTKVQRLKARATSHFLEQSLALRKYEGAALGRRTDGWMTAGTSANKEISIALPRLRNRSRDLVRNNPYAARGIDLIAANVIGKGIVTQVKLKGEKTNAKERVFETLWKEWSELTNIDFDGQNNFFGLQRLVMREVVESGECLVRKRYVRSADKSSVSIQLQILEGDFLNTSLLNTQMANGNRIIQGIEFDKRGRRVAYHLFEEHPGGCDLFSTVNKSNRIPAEEVLHLYRSDRAGQVRGVPWLSPVILRLRDFDEYEDAQLTRQKIAACFTAFVHDIEVQEDSTTAAEELGEKVEPGTIEFLPSGKTVTFASPPGVQNYQEYASNILHSIASGLGVSYESLTGDLSQVNFSSARMGWLEFQRNIDCWRSHIILPQFIKPVFDWFVESTLLLGLNPEGITASWTPPRREMIDPTKEIPAMLDAVRAGFIPLSEIIKMYGFDPTDHFEQMKKDNEKLDAMQLTLDSDPRRTAHNGTLQREK